MLHHFMSDRMFSENINDIGMKTKEQLEQILQAGNHEKLDWYFTEIPDLRCGIRPLNAVRADLVFLRIRFSTPGILHLKSRHLQPDYNNSDSLSAALPLSRDDLTLVLAGFPLFSSEYLPEGKLRGFLPEEYSQGAGRTDENILTDDILDFDENVKDAYDLDATSLNRYLQSTAVSVASRHVTQIVFDRNPYVVAAVLRKANGVCEYCQNRAPFNRKTNGLPYLEVHHVVPLSQGGLDTLENTVAICPNCHRKAHFG